MRMETTEPAAEVSTKDLAISGMTAQTLASLLAGVILFGVAVGGVYIAVRRSTPKTATVAAAQAPPSTPAAIPAPVQPVQAVVPPPQAVPDPAATQPAPAAPPRATTQPVQPTPVPPPAKLPSAVTPPKPASPPPAQATAITAEESRGKTFLQVGAIDRTSAAGFVAGLTRKGFSVRIADGPSAGTVRILVGPLSGAALAEAKDKLSGAGVASFPKTY